MWIAAVCRKKLGCVMLNLYQERSAIVPPAYLQIIIPHSHYSPLTAILFERTRSLELLVTL